MAAIAVYCKADTLLKRGGINRKEKGSAHRATLCNEVTSAVRKIIGIEITLNPEISTLTYKKRHRNRYSGKAGWMEIHIPFKQKGVFSPICIQCLIAAHWKWIYGALKCRWYTLGRRPLQAEECEEMVGEAKSTRDMVVPGLNHSWDRRNPRKEKGGKQRKHLGDEF